MKYTEIKRLFALEVKDDQSFKEFRERYEISDKQLSNLRHEGLIDLCPKCREYHIKNDRSKLLFLTNLTMCDVCLMGYDRNIEMNFKRMFIKLRKE